jgi:hypothetical protein
VEGITFDPSALYTPEQNSSAEHSGGVIIQRAQAMRVHARLPEDLWPEIVPAAAYILNRTPNRQLDWKTPLEVLHQLTKIPHSPPSIAHLQVYGARAYPLINKIPKTEKLKSRAHIGYLVGYDSTNIFRIWIPSKKQVIRTRDVTFDEMLFYDPGTLDITQQLQIEAEQVIEVVDMASSQPLIDRLNLDIDTESDFDQASGVQQSSNRHKLHELSKGVEAPDSNLPDHKLPTSSETKSHELTPATTSRQLTPSSNMIVVTSSGISTNRQSTLPPTESEDPSANKGRKPGYKNNEVSSDMSEDLILTNRRRHPHREGFLAAAEKEYHNLERRQTFCHVPKTPGLKTLPLMWTFVYKLDTDGYLVKYKAHLCIRGDLQEPTYLDTYTTTLAARIFRTLMVIIAAFNLEARQYDIVNAFTNSKLDETIHCTCPEGYSKEGLCLLLLQALYGLRRSPILWLKEFSKTLQELGLEGVPGETCLFTNDRLIIFFYVDDIVALCCIEHLPSLIEFEKILEARYEIHSLRELNWFLGVRIIRDRQARKVGYARICTLIRSQ